MVRLAPAASTNVISNLRPSLVVFVCANVCARNVFAMRAPQPCKTTVCYPSAIFLQCRCKPGIAKPGPIMHGALRGRQGGCATSRRGVAANGKRPQPKGLRAP